MNLTQEQVAILSNYFNGQVNLPVAVSEIAELLRNVVTPEVAAPAPVADPIPAADPKVDGGPSVETAPVDPVVNA